MNLLLLQLLACDLDGRSCPPDEEKFEPRLDPGATYDVDYDNCEEGAFGLDGIVVYCQPTWCADGYEGDYCVEHERFSDWYLTHCEECYDVISDRGSYATRVIFCDDAAKE